MFSTSKIKCPRCSKQILKRVMLVTHGKCNNCGYVIAGAITSFVSKPKPAFDTTSGLNV